MERREGFKNMVQNEHLQFKQQINNEIKQQNITENNNREYCIIKSNWIKEIFNRDNYEYENFYFFTEKVPKLISNISKNIKENFQLIKKDLLNKIFNDYQYIDSESNENNSYNNYYSNIYDNIQNAETFTYIAGYNKLIIKSEKNSSLLILNPIDSIINNNNFMVGILLNYIEELNYNNEFYKKLITIDLDLNNNKIQKKLKRNLIIDESEENYEDNDILKEIMDKIKTYKRKILLKNNRILICVNLYSYEKNLKLKEKVKAFKKYDDYYIINNEWLNKYKALNQYEKIFNILKKNEENNKIICLDYYNMPNYRYTIFNNLANFDDYELIDNLNINFNEMKELDEKNNNSYIIHFRIIELILKNENLKLNNFHPIQIYVKDCFIYLIDKIKLNIGTLNDNLTFNTKYVIEYATNTISDKEIKLIEQMSIEEYLKLRKCKIKVKKENSILKLYNDEKSNLGTVLIIDGKNNEEEISNKSNIKLNDSELNNNQFYEQAFYNAKSELSKLSDDYYLIKKNYWIKKMN